MSCEMCGRYAGPDLIECEVDGVRMFLCRKCSKFGTKNSEKKHRPKEELEVSFVKSKPGEKGPSVTHIKVKSGQTLPTRPARRGRRDILETNQVLIDDYGAAIKEARKAKGWSLESFAQMINEKASLLQKIEKSEFHPPESLIVKIERKLDISLREEAAPPVYTSMASKKELTLGDVVKLKKKKKD